MAENIDDITVEYTEIAPLRVGFRLHVSRDRGWRFEIQIRDLDAASNIVKGSPDRIGGRG